MAGSLFQQLSSDSSLEQQSCRLLLMKEISLYRYPTAPKNLILGLAAAICYIIGSLFLC